MRFQRYMGIMSCLASLILAMLQTSQAEEPAVEPASGYLPTVSEESAALHEAQNRAEVYAIAAANSLDVGKTAQAEEFFGTSLKLDPEGGAGIVFVVMGDYYVLKGQFMTALPLYEKGYKLVTNPPPDYCMKYVLALFKTGRREKALQVYEEGCIRLRENGITPPDVDFRKVLFTPARFESFTRTAIALSERMHNHENSAIRQCQEAVRLLPSNALAYLTLGDTYEWKRLGSPEARAAWQKAAELGSGDVQKKAQENLKR